MMMTLITPDSRGHPKLRRDDSRGHSQLRRDAVSPSHRPGNRGRYISTDTARAQKRNNPRSNTSRPHLNPPRIARLTGRETVGAAVLHSHQTGGAILTRVIEEKKECRKGEKTEGWTGMMIDVMIDGSVGIMKIVNLREDLRRREETGRLENARTVLRLRETDQLDLLPEEITMTTREGPLKNRSNVTRVEEILSLHHVVSNPELYDASHHQNPNNLDGARLPPPRGTDGIAATVDHLSEGGKWRGKSPGLRFVRDK